MGAVQTSAGALRIAVGLAAALVLLLAAFAGLLGVAVGSDVCAGGDEASPSATADRAIPSSYLRVYRAASGQHGIPWQILAAIGAIETDHGRSTAPGVRAGLNSYGCCAGPMQFNLTDGPPSTWQRYRVDGDRDGRLVHDLGWTPGCGSSGTRPSCPLVPAIQFIGYDGYPNHGSPRTCGAGCAAHLHISWASPCFGTSAPSAPCTWVSAFTTSPETLSGR